MAPTTVPFALTTRRTWLSVAPVDSSIPIERRRRWARTVNPPTETSATSSIPSTSAASEIVSGLSGLLDAADAGVDTCQLVGNELHGTPAASNSTVTLDGFVTRPGTTSANSSRRLCGFSTIPTTRCSTPPTRQVSPTERWNAETSPLVTATSSAREG